VIFGSDWHDKVDSSVMVYNAAMKRLRTLLFYVLTLVVSVQLTIPTGFMPGSSNGVPTIVMCSGKVTAATSTTAFGQKDNKHNAGVCTFAAHSSSATLTTASVHYAVQSYAVPVNQSNNFYRQATVRSYLARGPPQSFD